MSTGRPPPGSIPTLTEVVPWPNVALPVSPPAAPQLQPQPMAISAAPELAPGAAVAPAQAAVAVAPETPTVGEAEFVQRVMLDMQRQIEQLLEVRLREALAPAVVRATDTLAREARKELTGALRDIATQAVRRELERRDKG